MKDRVYYNIIIIYCIMVTEMLLIFSKFVRDFMRRNNVADRAGNFGRSS